MSAPIKLRDLRKAIGNNDGSRTLVESALVPEVAKAIADWERYADIDGVLIGAVAFSYYAKPRYTEDVDFLFKSRANFPERVTGFNKHRDSAFEHKQTGVEVELVTAESFKPALPDAIVDKVIATAVKINKVKVVSPEGYVALKLHAPRMKDQADAVEMLKAREVDLSDWPLSADKRKLLQSLQQTAENEK